VSLQVLRLQRFFRDLVDLPQLRLQLQKFKFFLLLPRGLLDIDELYLDFFLVTFSLFC
jgi:hypothetical protein